LLFPKVKPFEIGFLKAVVFGKTKEKLRKFGKKREKST